MNKNKWFPVICNTSFAAVALLIYTFRHMNEIDSLVVLQIVIGAMIPFLLIVLTDLLEIKFPPVFHMMIVILVILAIYLGNGCSFYSFVPFYDKFLHLYFGFICSLIMLCVLIYYNCERLATPLLLFVVFFFTLGLGGIWELFEFVCDILTDGDSLGVNSSINNGHHPCFDIMMDLVVTMIGNLIFYFVILIDKFNNFPLSNYLKAKIDKERQ